MALTIHQVLRDLIGGRAVLLRDDAWQADALAAVDAHEAAGQPAAAATTPPADPPAAPDTSAWAPATLDASPEVAL